MICEDTRVSKNLISLLNSKFELNIAPKEFYALHTHNVEEFFSRFDAVKFENKVCVYASDAGFPCISDPGVDLVRFAQERGISYEVLPGANAALLAAAASGLIEKEFTFLGFLPNTGKERTLAIQNALNSPYPVIVYESPRRVEALVAAVAELDAEREVFAIKEATKKFETKFRGLASELKTTLANSNLNGEWCVVIAGSHAMNTEKISVADVLALDLPPKQKAKLIAKITGEDSKIIYQNLIKKS